RHHRGAVDLRRARIRLAARGEAGIAAEVRRQVHPRKGRGMSEEHPARVAARASQAAASGKRKDEWLALFAEDACVEDPVGPSGFDPEGKGHHGHEAIGKFYDMTIANTEKLEFLRSEERRVGKRRRTE